MEQAFIKDVIGWDIVNWSKAITLWEHHLPKGRSLQCLELGGNKGGLSLWLASMGHHVICSDLHNPADLASALHKKHDVTERVRYEAINATNIPYRDHFDVVIFKSILGGIARNGRDEIKYQVIQQIYQSLKPGGVLLFAENLEASALHIFMRKRFTSWGKEWNYLKYKEVETLFKDFKRFEFKTAGFLGAFGKTEMQRTIAGKIDSTFFDRILPESNRYILYGAAFKG